MLRRRDSLAIHSLSPDELPLCIPSTYIVVKGATSGQSAQPYGLIIVILWVIRSKYHNGKRYQNAKRNESRDCASVLGPYYAGTAGCKGQLTSNYYKKLMARKAQTRLQFSPLPSSSPSKEDYSGNVQDRLANVRFNRARGQLQKPEAASIPTPEPSSQPQSGSVVKDSATISQNEEDDEVESPTVKRRKTSSNRARQTTLTPRRSSRLQYQGSVNIRPSSSASSSSSQRFHSVKVPSPTPTRRTRSLQIEEAQVKSSPPAPINSGLSGLGSPEASEDDDDVIATKPAIQRRRLKQFPPGKDDFVVPDNENISPFTDEEDTPVTPKPHQSKSKNQTPRSRRLKSRREYQELKEDLEDLHDSDSPELQSSRTRGAPVNKERERRREYIERLKRRRAGQREPIQVDTDDDDEPEDIDYIASYASNNPAPILHQRIHADREGSILEQEDGMPPYASLNADEDDFVVSDEEDASLNLLGRPHPDIPLRFTSYASAKPRELFVHVIEWLVKNRIAPAFPRHDPLWKLAFTKIKDQVNAQAGSRLKSSAWTGSFTNALNARPELTTAEILPNENLMRGCDACNRTNHPATYEFVFSGSAYHHDSLEPVDPDSSSDAEAENIHDNASIDSQGHELPRVDRHFYLGRYCAANAELAHRFTHWKYSLNEELMRHLESQGVLSAEEIVRRERSKGGQRKREKEAEDIVDQMKVTGVIDDLWKGFKADLDDARIGMEGHDRKGVRGSKRIGSVRVPVSDTLIVDDDNGVGNAGER